MEKPFGEGLAAAAAVEDSLDLQNAIRGHNETSISAVAEMIKFKASLTQVLLFAQPHKPLPLQLTHMYVCAA